MKKTVIYYFSSTGNCLSVSRKLIELLDEGVVLFNIAELDSLNVIEPDADNVGLVFPVYALGVPLIVRRFISRLKVKENSYIFALATYGGIKGPVLYDVALEFKQNATSLDNSFSIKQPDNYVPFFSKPTRNKVQECIAQGNETLALIAEDIKADKARVIKFNPIQTFIVKLFSSIVSKSFKNEDKSFRLNDKCNACGVCAKVCPVDNVDIVDSKPVWKHNCEHCLACLHWCPQAAIMYKKKLWQYHHPLVSLQDMIYEKENSIYETLSSHIQNKRTIKFKYKENLVIADPKSILSIQGIDSLLAFSKSLNRNTKFELHLIEDIEIS